MANKRHKPEEIVTKLRQVEVLVGQGVARIDAIRQVRIVEQTYYRWRKQYGGMGTAQLKELKRLQKENEHLRRAVSDLTLDKLILTEASRGNFQAPRVVGFASIRYVTSCMYPSAGFVACLANIDQPSGIDQGAEKMKNALWRT